MLIIKKRSVNIELLIYIVAALATVILIHSLIWGMETATRINCGNVPISDYVNKPPTAPAKCVERWNKGDF